MCAFPGSGHSEKDSIQEAATPSEVVGLLGLVTVYIFASLILRQVDLFNNK